MALALHNFIQQHNPLTHLTDKSSEFLHTHPRLYKLALLINHLFRAIAMTALMHFLPFSLMTNTLLCLTGSIFYRLTVENNCAYKFALPAFFGSLAFLAAKHTVLPLLSYSIYVLLTVSYDVDERCGRLLTH
jgi:hypothetical protein